MDVEQARRLAQSKLQELSEDLERGQSATLRAYLSAMAKFPTYSPHNVMLIAAQRPSAERVAGFQTWRRLGRHVRKGERGIVILAPIVRRSKGSVSPSSSAASQVPEARTQQHQEEVIVGFRRAHVFDECQTDGAPLPNLSAVAGDPGPYIDRLRAFIAKRGVALHYSASIMPALGACVGSTIILSPGLSPPEHLATLAHEVAHQLLHQRTSETKLSKTVRETEAEAVAFVVCESIGLTSRSASREYVQLWGGSAEVLSASLGRIQRTAAEIITAIGPDV